MPLDPSGFPFIFSALAAALVLGAAFGWMMALPLVVLAAFFVFFFRDPERRPRAGRSPEAVLAPADGTVLVAGAALADAAPPGSWKQVSIFLSPLDVHVNRIPVSGRVTKVLYTRGRFVPAYRRDAGVVNERTEMWIDHDGQTVVARQVAGILARRVVCRVTTGATVEAGQRFGIMKFGSRMDVFVPDTANITVKIGEKVRSGETLIAVLHSGGEQ